jgi:hypothetical protein
MTPSVPRRFGALLLSTALFTAACGSTTVSPSPAPSGSAASTPSPTASGGTPTASPGASATPLPSGAAAAVYATIEEQVVALRGLKPVAVARQTIDAATLKTMNATSFEKDNPPEYVAGNDRLLKALGLIAADQSLQKLYLDLIDSQVAGFYRPDDKTLYVVSRSGAINGADKITFAHEYDHALQDASFPGVFDAQKDLLDQSDQALARAAIYEGDATLLMSQWALPNLTPAELQDVVAAGADPESSAVLARTPQALVDGLLFPYNAGLAFLAPMQSAGGWAAVDDVFKDLPVSTEQVLHPQKYADGEAPIKVAIPADALKRLGDGWTIPLEDTYGEFQISTWLRESGVPTSDAADAAAGWGGDRLAVLDGPGDHWALVLHTVWDTAADAAAFEVAASQAARRAGGPADVLPGTGGTTRWLVIGDDAATLTSVEGALGLAG